MNRSRSVALIIGVLVCIPVLLMHRFGIFTEVDRWFAALDARLFVLPAELRTMRPLQYGYHILLVFLSAFVCMEMTSQWRRFAFLIAITFLTTTFSFLLAFAGILMEPVSGSLTAWLTGIAAIAASGIYHGERTEIMRSLFSGRLSTAAFDELSAQNNPAALTGRRELTVLCFRVLNHPELAHETDGLKFEEISARMQRSVSGFIISRGGYLDDADAQSLQALFGFPLTDEHHALHAAQVAAALRAHLSTLAMEVEQACGKKPRFGVALATGEAMCGLLGMDDFQSFSASGEACDLAGRLCGLNALYGSRVLLSARTYAQVKEKIEVRPMEMLYAPSGQPLGEIYELLAEKGTLPEADARARDAFWQGVVQYRQGDNDKALQSFQNALVENREDGPVRYFTDLATAHLKDKGRPADAIPKHGRLLTA
jgi:class 3 adenylate cyclase